MIKAWLSNRDAISEFDVPKKREVLKYIEELEERVMLMKVQMHGDCGCCKNRDKIDVSGGPCQTCQTDDDRPNWEYEGLPEVKGK